MRINYQTCIMMTALFFMIGCTTKYDLNAISAGMDQKQVIEKMGVPTDSAAKQAATLLVYGKNSQAPLHLVFLNNQLVEYGQENHKSDHAVVSASAQLDAWLAEQGKIVNPSAIAGCKMLEQRVDCGI